MDEVKTKKAESAVQPERTHFLNMIAKNANYFGNIPGSELKKVMEKKGDTFYEEISCVGYNPDTANMEATFSVKKPYGYSGDLCQSGSFEYLRFYLDFHDGSGFIDQGSVAVNVHDIPEEKDCKGAAIFPLKYVATLKKKTPNFTTCDKPLLPTLRVILSWSYDPPPNSPGWSPVWGNVVNSDVQIKPFILLKPLEMKLDMTEFLFYAAKFPDLSAKQLSQITGADLNEFNPEEPAAPLPELIKKYDKLKVPASRFAFKTVHNMIKYSASELTMLDKSLMKELKIDIGPLIDDLSVVIPKEKTSANIDYEELECIGLDYNLESLVATVKIKKECGFAGDLCHKGSKEYISFWIDWDDKCKWQYLNTVELKVHDIDMKGSALYYSVSMPLDATFHKRLCGNPNIVRIRCVLSWAVPPSTTNPDKLEYYGNRIDAHIQIKPGAEINPDKIKPLFNIIGGIDVAHVNDINGLTKANSFFAFNGTGVPTDAPFGGIIVINGPSYIGHRYRIKVTNMNSGTVQYAVNSFTVVGFLPVAPYVQYTTQIPDPVTHFYNYLPVDKNTLNVLARFTPPTEDKYLFELEIEGVPGTFWKILQIDNTAPKLQLQVDDNGDCTHYKKGDLITGHFYVFDKHIAIWIFGTTWGGNASGTSNTIGLPGQAFSVQTNAGSYPCGSVSLYAVDKTIIDSQSVGHPAWASYIICLQ